MGNNRLQLQQFGAELQDTLADTSSHDSLAALMLDGARGRLGEAAGVESFEFGTWWCSPLSRRDTSR